MLNQANSWNRSIGNFAYVGPSSWNHLPLELRLQLVSLPLPVLELPEDYPIS